LAAAAALYAQHGLENVTFGQIAKRARLSRPLVYFYFPDQQALFLEVVQGGIERLHARFQVAYDSGKNGLEQIENIGRAYASFVVEDPIGFKLCMLFDAQPTGLGTAPGKGESVLACKMKSNTLCVKAIENGMADGSIRRDVGPPAIVALALWGCVDGMVHLGATEKTVFRVHPELSPAMVLDMGMDLLRSALRGR
jgi:AcrR family transcriptional regulator